MPLLVVTAFKNQGALGAETTKNVRMECTSNLSHVKFKKEIFKMNKTQLQTTVAPLIGVMLVI